MKSNQNINTNSDCKLPQDSLTLKGINVFKSKLEKFFFADADIKITETKPNTNSHLNISLNCNFGLTESLFHLNSGNWGGFCKNSSKLEYSGFELAVQDLEEENTNEIIIEEIAIHFKDTSLFITKIPSLNITDQLCDILSAVSENFVHFTRGLTEMPYEIFVPVFEEDSNVPCNNNKKITSYFNYWGMYFHSDVNQDSLVYDLKSKTIIDGDFFLLNKE
jgi:hypothetical protein